MNETFYKDHWVSIEPDRFDRYKQMFGWSESARPLLEPARIKEGEIVVDLGCGPGFTAVELAKWVGSKGIVHGIDVNKDFIEFGRSLAETQGLQSTVTFHHVTETVLPLPDESADCIVAKNVLVYADDPLATYRDGYRILKKGGRFHAVEGDWDLAFAEPLGKDWKTLIDAASIAFRTRSIGRRLYGYARAAGFSEVTASVVCRPDITGELLPMIRNLCDYARQSEKLKENKIESIFRQCEEAVKNETLLIVCPQFVVTATV